MTTGLSLIAHYVILWFIAEQAAGIADTYDETRTYLRFLAGGAAVDANLDAYVDNGPAVLREFERMGARFRIIKGLPDHYYPDAPGTKAAGRALEAVPLQRKELGPWADALQQGPYTPPGMTWTAWNGTCSSDSERRDRSGFAICRTITITTVCRA